jgi:hypothetical protein
MARKKAPRRRTASPRTPARTKTGNRVDQIASTVWVEIGPIWLERNPKRINEVIVSEIHTRRIKQG